MDAPVVALYQHGESPCRGRVSQGPAAGVDGQSGEEFAYGAKKYLAELEKALMAGAYRPLAVRRETFKGRGNRIVFNPSLDMRPVKVKKTVEAWHRKLSTVLLSAHEVHPAHMPDFLPITT